MKLLVLFASLALFTGCASVSYSPQYEKLGEYVDTKELVETADEMKWKDADEIKVFIGTMPEGFSVEGGKVKTTSKSVEVLGKVTADWNKYSHVMFYDYNEDEDWKNTYCAVQRPLVWVTLLLWTFIPVHYPCVPGETDSNESVQARKDKLIKTLKKMTKVAGGNAVVVTEVGDVQVVDAVSKVKVGGLKMTSASGYAIKYVEAVKK